MPVIFFLLGVVSIILLAVGLLRPATFAKRFGYIPTRKKLSGIFGGATIGFLVLLFATSPATEQTGVTPTPSQQVAVIESASPTTEPSSGNSQATKTPKASNPAPTPVATSSATLYTVTSVTDGDTFKVSINGTTETIRSIGMDTPETVDPRKPVQCFGVEASNRTKQLLSGKKVRLEADATQGERDKYGRLLRYAYLEDGRLFNKLMIQEGYAHEYTYDTKYRYQADFKTAQVEAQSAKRGLWADNACQTAVSPTPAPVSACGAYCTSSHSSAKFYYCDNDPGWQGLSSSYLKSFPTKEALLAKYPSRTLHDQALCP